MSTPRQIAAQIVRLLSAGPRPKDSKLDMRYIMREAIQMCNQLIRKEFFQTLNMGGRDVSELAIATYANQPVLLDTTFNRCYTELPSFYVNLPGGLGLQQIRPQDPDESDNRPMIIVRPHEIDMTVGSLYVAEVIKDQWIAEPDRDKVYFSERNDGTLLDAGIENVEIKIAVVDPDQIGENDMLPIDPGSESELISMVLQLHGYTGKEAADLINNSNPNIK